MSHDRAARTYTEPYEIAHNDATQRKLHCRHCETSNQDAQARNLCNWGRPCIPQRTSVAPLESLFSLVDRAPSGVDTPLGVLHWFGSSWLRIRTLDGCSLSRVAQRSPCSGHHTCRVRSWLFLGTGTCLESMGNRCTENDIQRSEQTKRQMKGFSSAEIERQGW
jgi:hypothetical protein